MSIKPVPEFPMETLLHLIKQDEGTGPVENNRLMPYEDSVGVLTIGYGRAIGSVGISFDEANILLKNSVLEAIKDCDRNFDWFDGLDDTRKMVVISMVYNLGITRFRGFKKTIAAIAEGGYYLAAIEMLDSKWARQVGRRARDLSLMMEAGALNG